MKYFLLSASALSLTVIFPSASAESERQIPGAGTTNDTMVAANYMTGLAPLSEMTTTAKGFANAAALSDMYEIAAGKLASGKAKSASVKSFAAKMITAHTQTTNKLKATLASTHPDITPPLQLDARHQAVIDELRGANGADFDSRYVAQQIDAHKEALMLMNGYAKDGDAQELKKVAADTAPIVQMHLSMAEKLGGSR
jgi:putative membrane protein